MGASGDLRHHPAIGRMQIELRAHHARQDFALPIRRKAHHCGGGLVATRLDAEHGQGTIFAGLNHGGSIAPKRLD